jgi:hypothetical protein
MATATANNAKFILATGPSWECDAQDREVAFYYVGVSDEDDFIGRVYQCQSRQAAMNLATKMSQDRRLPLELELD